MSEKRQSIAKKFIVLSVVSLTIILSASSFVGLTNTKTKLRQQYDRQADLITGNSKNKAALLLDVISKISPESILGKDLYSIRNFADPICDDADVASVEIFDKTGSLLYKVESKDAAELSADQVEYYETQVKTDPEKMGAEIVTGSVKLGFSKKRLLDTVEKNKHDFARERKSNIIFSVFQAILTNIVIAIILFVSFQKIIIFPLKEIHKRVTDLAQGEGDLTLRISVDTKNEIGDLAIQINTFINNVHNLVKKIASGTVELSTSTKSIEAVAKNARVNIESVAVQSDSVTQNAENAAGNMNNVATSTEEISTSIGSVATAIEEMTATVNEIARNCQKESEISNTANIQAKETNEMIKKLEASANKIGNIIEIITDIADQTNLLALNATIEAASAGDAGRGFAVVASEVKELAKQTAQATQEISRQIDDIRLNTGSSVAAIEKITAKVADVSSISSTILSAVEQQASAINEISRNVSSVNSESDDVSKRIQQTARGLGDISRKIHDFNTEISNINVGMGQVGTSTTELAKITGSLKESVDKFKV